MLTAKGMPSMIPSHVLRVGQTICLDSAQATVNPPSGNDIEHDLDSSLDILNQLMLDLDPTFELNKSPRCLSPPTDDSEEEDSQCVLVPRGCDPCSPAKSPSILIPTPTGRNGTQSTVVFSSTPSTLPPLPFGSAPRRNPSPRQEVPCSPGPLRLSRSKSNSAISLLSMSSCSDTSYILGSNLSLVSTEDPDSPESILTQTSSSFNDGSKMKHFDPQYSPEKPPLPKGGLSHLHSKGVHSSPASLAGSFTDIPVLLVNGVPQLDQQINPSPGPDNSKPVHSRSFQAHFTGSQPSMKFVMDTSKCWFRPHISRAEAEALVKDKEPGTFVVRDSTSYRGSFGLAMKVDQSPTSCSADTYPGGCSSDSVRHFLIESSTKGVRIKGSSQEPYFGSLSALVYQHTISASSLPCKLRLHSPELVGEQTAADKLASEDKKKTASNFVYLHAVPTETLTGPCAVQRAVTSTLDMAPGSFIPTVVNLKASLKGVTLTDINRKLFFRRHYPARLLSFCGEDPENRLWMRGSSFGARLFGFVAKGTETSTENVCHVLAEYDQLQPYGEIIQVIQEAVDQS